MPPKKTKLQRSFFEVWFLQVLMKILLKTQRVISFKVLTQKSMKPNKIKQHFESYHDELEGKTVDYFNRKSEN